MATHPLRYSAPSNVNDCTSSTGWAAGAGTLSQAAPPDAAYGTATRLLLTSAVNTAAFVDLTLNSLLTGRLEVLVYLDEHDSGAGSIQNYGNCTVFASNNSGFTAYFSRTQVLNKGFNLLTFTRASTAIGGSEDCSWGVGAGSPTWDTNMVRIRVRIEAISGTATRLYICSIRDGGYFKPQVLLGFDDGLSSVYTDAFPQMQTYSLRGTMFVISSKPETVGYMTESQLQELYDAGWDIGNHTVSHTDMKDSDQPTCLTEISGCTDYLVSKGWTRRNCHLHFASPFGAHGYRQASPYRAAIAQAGMLTARGTVERIMGPFMTNPLNLNCIIPDGSAETLQNQVDRIDAVIGSGGMLYFLFHDIVTPANAATKWTPTNFLALIQYVWRLKSSGTIGVPTIAEYYQQVASFNPYTD